MTAPRSLQRALAAARTEPPVWDAAHTEAVWSGIDTRRGVRARRRRIAGASAVVAAVAVLALLGVRQLGSRDEGAEVSPSVTPQPLAGAAPSRAIETPEGSSPAVVDEPILVEEDEPDATLLAEAGTITHDKEGTTQYRAAGDWSGHLSVGDGAIEITGPGAAFSVTTDASATVVTVEAAVVVIEYGGERKELHPGEVLRVETTHVVAEDRTRRTPRDRPGPDALLEQADAARRRGDLADAAKMLRQFTKRHVGHADAATAWFQLGKVERRRGRHRAAATAFGTSRKLLRGKVLESDALAEHARSLAAAGKDRDAKARAEEYLRWKPGGLHAADMRAIVDAR